MPTQKLIDWPMWILRKLLVEMPAIPFLSRTKKTIL